MRQKKKVRSCLLCNSVVDLKTSKVYYHKQKILCLGGQSPPQTAYSSGIVNFTIFQLNAWIND